MKKKGLPIVLFLLCASFLMAAMAYNSASITSAASLKIVNTSEALLTLEANTPWSWQSTVGAKDNTATMENGELVFRFGKGVGRDGTTPYFYGLQPNSTYQWNPLFTLRNKSAETINVEVRATGTYAQYITFGTCGQSTVDNPTWGTMGSPYSIGNVPKETNSGMQNIREICVKIDLPSGVTISQSELIGSIIVDAVAVS